MIKVLVVGGAGYIGSHVVKLLGKKGFDLVVYDNLSTGNRNSVLYGKLVKGDVLDTNRLRAVMSDFMPNAVMDFAAKIVVPESIEYPLLYYINNVQGSLNILRVMKELNLDNFIFSSTAAVYGEPENMPIKETAPFAPVNPYGKSKVMVEEILKDCSKANELKYIALRYFNVAGADPEGELGEMKKYATHLITACVRTAAGKRRKLSIFGNDYSTPDGTCIRDYIHVIDLAECHLLALEHLLSGRGSNVFNCGYGDGYSVKEVVKEVTKTTGVNFCVDYADRRPGDPPKLVADSSSIKEELGWKPRYNDLSFIIKTAWDWEKK